MNTRLINLWYTIRYSLWFLPSLLTLFAGLLAMGTLKADQGLKGQLFEWVRPFGTMEPDGARALLSTVASSVITIAGVSFSITIVALTLASSQFGPRLLRTFMKNTGNQLVLGVFIATFVYSLIVLGAIRNREPQLFVPILSVLCSLIFALVSLGCFIYFIHNVSTSIHADNVVFAINRDLNRAIERIVTKRPNRHLPEAAATAKALPQKLTEESFVIRSTGNGYLQAIDCSALVTIAQEHDITLTLLHRPGDFVMEGEGLVQPWPPEERSDEFNQKVNFAFILGSQRTEEQDIEYAIHQMVELALRALSPGINDPFTAISCIDWLGTAINRIVEQGLPSPYYYDDQDELRVIADVPTMAGVFDAAFSQIRQHGCTNVAVTLRLLEIFKKIAVCTNNSEVRTAIVRNAEMVYGASQPHVGAKHDKEDVEERYAAVMNALQVS